MRARFNAYIFFLLSIACMYRVSAQCPANIGFENGTFDGWQCYSGTINSSGDINLPILGPMNDRHVLLKNTVPQEKDYYGDFPVNCPNGSNYCIRLGNSSTGSQAERVSYTFTIPAWQNDFSIIYNYAVVFQNPNPPHTALQQPSFTAKVFDVTANDYIGCGSFQFVVSSSLPGFQQSTVKSDVYYKPWSPVTIKLLGYAGKTIRLEFTTNDCSPGGHFGYAYVDVNENCASPISGNTYCAGTTDSITLVAPFGFQEYHWYTSDFSTMLGTSNTLTLSPPPPPGTSYALEVVPYPGLGCLDTLKTTILYSGTPFNLQVKDTLRVCSSDGADLTLPEVTTGSSPGLDFSYFTDLTQLNYVPTPTYVNTAGTYYIKGTNSDGCNGIKPVVVSIKTPPTVVVQGNAFACTPQKIDITAPSFTAGSDAGLLYSYWADMDATVPLTAPNAIDMSGSYFIKATDANGCSFVKPVDARISATPDLTVKDQEACGSIDLTQPNIITATPGSIVSFWLDNAATIALQDPAAINATGSYFVKAGNADGCEVIKPVSIVIKPVPNLTISDPSPVKFPTTVDLTALTLPGSGITYSYWMDSATTKPLLNFSTVDTTGVYYIKAINIAGCTFTAPVRVVVDEPDIVPSNAFSPNGDGINDVWEIPLLNRRYPYCNVEIFNRYGQSLFISTGYGNPWDGKVNGQYLPNGTYYYLINRGQRFPPLSGNISIVR